MCKMYSNQFFIQTISIIEICQSQLTLLQIADKKEEFGLKCKVK